MSKFYDDLLRDTDSHLDVDIYADPTRTDAFKRAVYGFRAAASKKVTVDHSYTQQYEFKDNKKVDSEKNATKITIAHGDCKTSWSFANDKFATTANAKAFDQDGWKANVSSLFELKPAKEEWKLEGNSSVSSPDLGGARAFFNFGFEHNSKKEWVFKPKLNLQVQDEINLGVSAEHDSKDFTKQFFQAVYQPKEGGDYFFRLDNKLQWLGLGCHHFHQNKIHHSYEAVYHYKEGAKGFQGQPLTVRGGFHYKLNESSTLQSTLVAGENWEAHQEVTHKIDEHWNVAAHQHFDSGKLATKNAYDLGFKLGYKL